MNASGPVPKRSLTTQIKEVEAEIEMRRKVYPGQVGRGAMKDGEAEYKILTMCSVLETLRWLQRHETTIKASIGGEGAS